MRPTSAQQLADLARGRLAAAADSAPVTSITNESAKAAPGVAFIALRGETRDGHDFVPDAIARGAKVAIVERELSGVPTQIIVADTRQALRDLGAAIRGRFDRCKVVGVAGSNGKTSTKHLVAAALGSTLRGTASPKSFNNDIGVPLTIFDADPAQDFCVLELGTNHHGEIRTLAHIARPDVCVITNCTAEHLEGLTDLDGVRLENASVTDGMTKAGTLIVLGDDPLLRAAIAGFRGRIVRFGFDASNDLRAADVVVDDGGTSFTLGSTRVRLPMIGRHNALNALAAIAVARAFDVSDVDAIRGLSTSSKPEMRMDRRVSPAGVVVLDDAYNANPASMRGAIETLVALAPAPGGRRIAVLGEMREMGEHSERLHRELGRLIASTGGAIAEVACVAEGGAWLADELGRCSFAGDFEWFEDSQAAAAALAPTVRAGDLVLVKGSRGVRMERVVERLLAANVARATSP